jgi:thioredoxin 1
MSTATDVTDATFADQVLNSEDTIMVDFWAEWCGPCRAVSPILDQIAAEHSSRLTRAGLSRTDLAIGADPISLNDDRRGKSS